MRPASWSTAITTSLLATSVAAEKLTEEMPVIEKTLPLRTHTLYAPYVDQDLQNRWWDFGADALINTNKHVRLTQDKPSQMGYLWSRMPILPANENFQIDVEFSVEGKTSAHNLFGDGFAMWLTTDRAKPGPVFGSVDFFTGLGIFFDTYPNSRHAYSFPRVTAMMGDGKTSYDLDHDGESNELAACSIDFRKRDIPTKLRLTYLKGKALQLKLQVDKPSEWETCFEIDSQLPAGDIYLGFTALTGQVTDNHDIISIASYTAVLHDPSIHNAQKIMMEREDRARAKRDKGKNGVAVGWFLFVLKAIGVLAFCAFAFSAYRTYAAQKKGKRF